MNKHLNKENFFLILIGLISFFLSISYSINQHATDGGLVISNIVKYPDGFSIMKMYYYNLYSFLHQFSSFLLELNLSAINVSRLLLFFSTLFYFTGIYLTVKSVTKSVTLGFLIALTVLIFRKNFGNVDYPTLIFSDLTFSMMGLSIVTLIYGLIANKNLFLVGFFSFFLISIHPIIGSWTVSILFLSFFIQKIIWKKLLVDKNFFYGVALGLLIVVTSITFYYFNKIDVSFLNFNKEIYEIYMNLWESHRIKSEGFFQSLHYEYLIKSFFLILICFLFLKYIYIKNHLCQLMFIFILCSSIFSIFIYVFYKINPNLFPEILISINPTRFVLMHSVIGIPIIMSFFYLLFNKLLIKKKFNINYSFALILFILIFYSTSHYKNILIRIDDFNKNFSSINYSYGTKEFWDFIKESKIDGHILTNNDLTSLLVTRNSLKPAFFQIGLMDMIPYFPKTAGHIKNIMEKVYDIPFNKPPTKNLLAVPDKMIKENFEKKSIDDWKKISEEFNINALIVPSGWVIKLNLEYKDKVYAYYKI